MIDYGLTILAYIGKITVFCFILYVFILGSWMHSRPKVTEYSFEKTVSLTIFMVVIYSLAGIFKTYSHALIFLGLMHGTDIIINIRKNNMTEFGRFNGIKSGILMISYFLILYLVNFWSPVLSFVKT